MSVHARIAACGAGLWLDTRRTGDGLRALHPARRCFSEENNKMGSNTASGPWFLSKYGLRPCCMEIIWNIDVSATKWTARGQETLLHLETFLATAFSPGMLLPMPLAPFPLLVFFCIWNIYHTIWSWFQWSPFTWHSSRPWVLVLSYFADQETDAQACSVIKRIQNQICLTPEPGCVPLGYTLFYIISSYLF